MGSFPDFQDTAPSSADKDLPSHTKSCTLPPAQLPRKSQFSAYRLLQFYASCVITAGVVVLGVWLQAQILGSNPRRPNVNKSICDCACWDGRFKGSYSLGGYKSLYFNFDHNMVLITFWTVPFLVMLKSAVSRITDLMIFDIQLRLRGQLSDSTIARVASDGGTLDEKRETVTVEGLSYTALLLFLLSAYSCFYGAWALINYLNDQDWRMIRSQLFFTLTELLPTYIYVLALARPVRLRRRADDLTRFVVEFTTSASFFSLEHVPTSHAYPVATMAFVHLAIAISEGVLFGRDNTRPGIGLRDLGLMSADFLGLAFGLGILASRSMGSKGSGKFGRRKAWAMWSCAGTSLWLLYWLTCTFE